MSQTAATADEPFVEVPVRDRFYQASSFFPLPVVLVSTRAEDGAPNLAPYSLMFPDPDPARRALHLTCRRSSNTAQNLVRSGRATICFIPDEARYLQNLCIAREGPYSCWYDIETSVRNRASSAMPFAS